MAKPLRLNKEQLIKDGWEVISHEGRYKIKSPDGQHICFADSEDHAWEIIAIIVPDYNDSNEQLLAEVEKHQRELMDRLEDLKRDEIDARDRYQNHLQQEIMEHNLRMRDILERVSNANL